MKLTLKEGTAVAHPVLSEEGIIRSRAGFLDREGKVGYRRGHDAFELEKMDCLKVIVRGTSHMPDKGQVMVCH